jgi:hypothetical protein
MLARLVYSTEAHGLPSLQKMKDAQSERERREQADVMSVALAQPHRRGISAAESQRAGGRGLRLTTPLGRFCEANHLADGLYQAGIQYGEVCRAGKSAKGFIAHKAGEQLGFGSSLTDAQIAAMNEAAMMRWASAEAVLRQIMQRLPAAMERMCFDDRDPSFYDRDLLKNGLFRLAIHFATIDRGINAEKGA